MIKRGNSVVFNMRRVQLLCFIVLVTVVRNVELSNTSPKRQSQTYSDFLDGVSTRVRLSGDAEHASLIEDLNDKIYELYFSIRSYLVSRNLETATTTTLNDKGKLRNAQNSFESVILLSKPQSSELKWGTEHGPDAENEPGLLYRILNSLKTTAGNNSTFKSNSTSTCIDDIGGLITGLLSSEPWAVQFFDATGKPGPSLTRFHLNFIGNYDQCLAASAPPSPSQQNKKRHGFRGNYFRIKFFTSNPLLLPQLGACLPDTCSSSEISSLFEDMVKGLKFKGMSMFAHAEKLPQPTEMTTATVCATCILSIIGIMMVIGTIIDVVVNKPWITDNKDDENDSLVTPNTNTHVNNPNSNPNLHDYHYQNETVDENRSLITSTSGRNSNSDASISIRSGDINSTQRPINDDTAPLIYSHHQHPTNNPHPNIKPTPTNTNTAHTNTNSPSCLAVSVFLAFSVYTNGKKLLNTKQNPGSLGAVHGIRFFSMSWVVLCHWYGFSLSFLVNPYDELPNMIRRWTFLPILNGFSSVDSFFTLSGLLTSYLTIKEMKRKETANINWLMFYFHRFWRLTPPYMLAMLTVLGFSQYLGEGPMWAVTQPGDKIACEKNWWTNLLYVNNLVKTDEACFGHSWYLANDMQFFVISPIMLIPFFFNKFYGLLSCGLVLLTTFVTSGVLSSIHNWPTNTISLHPVAGRAGQPEWFSHYYIVPWCRIGPFIIGIMAGYLLAMTKGRRFKMPWWVVVLGWLVSTASGLAVVYGLRGDITGDNPSSIGAAALYNAVSRSVWGACVCWVVIACSAGYGGPINALLSWSPFVVLGRLTYMVYLIHLCIGGTFYQSLGALLYFSDKIMVTTFLGVFAAINMVAFVAVLALESPMLGLEKLFLKRDRGN